MRGATLSLLLSIAGAVRAQQTAWGQFHVGTTNVKYQPRLTSQDYSQCLPSSSPPITTAAASSKTTLATSKSTSSQTTKSSSVVSLHTTSSTKTTSTAASTTISGGGSTGYPGTTLQSGYYWIRAVESPNFHKYLQTSPEYKPGTAILDSYTTAGQFQIINGQLVELISGGFLYANVQQQANSTVNKLAVTFATTQNTYGTFAFSGDAVQWSVPSISRPNLSAWLVCANQQLFINLGAYAYLTPAGCADETIHFYNGATAVS